MNSDTPAIRRLHPATIFLRFVREAPSTLLALPAGLAFAADGNLRWVATAAAMIAALVVLFNWLAWRRFRYGVGERDIIIESGVLTRTRRSIPFDRIQDVDIERKLLARLFGLARVKIETGGSGQDEGLLDSVTLEEAERLRSAIRAGRDLRPAMPEEAASQGTEGRTIFEMGVRRLLLSGLFNFSLVYLAGLFALLQTFDRWLPFDIYDPARWSGLADKALPQRFTPVALFSVGLFAILLGVLAGLLRTVTRDHGFRLLAEEGRMRRVRGLFTHSEVVLAKPRLQLALVATGPVRRFFGWFELLFQSLGAGSDGTGRQSAAPLALRLEIATVMAEAGSFRLPSGHELSMVSRRHAARSLLPLFPLAPAIATAAAFQREWLWLFLLLPLLPLHGWIDRRLHCYGLSSGLIFISRGIWRQRLWIIPIRNVQATSLSRSLSQRWLGLASLSIDTAGAPMVGAPAIVDVRRDLAELLRAEISRQRRSDHSGRKSGTDR